MSFYEFNEAFQGLKLGAVIQYFPGGQAQKNYIFVIKGLSEDQKSWGGVSFQFPKVVQKWNTVPYCTWMETTFIW